MSRKQKLRAYRASVLHCLDDPGSAGERAIEYFDDGLLVIADGLVREVGPAETLLPKLPPELQPVDYRGKLLVPGFIDCHVHYPQIEMIASYGEQLLEWLERYAYPAERRFADESHAGAVAEFFIDQLLKHGTTTALVFATVHPQSVNAIFESAQRRNLRLLSGKTLMDRDCPDDLRDGADHGIADSRALIERWHGQGRLGYAITPRFAVTSSEAQLAAAGALAADFPDVHLHTHLAENEDEVACVRERFPAARSYLDVYRQHGLLRERAVFAHCLHLDDRDRGELATAGSAIAFCPGSNLFLGSGLFDLAAADRAGVRVGAGSDVGGGPALGIPATLGDGYKALQLQGQSLSPARALYLATLGGARALHLDNHIGNFRPGREADFVLLDSASTEVMARRTAGSTDALDRLFALMLLGDDRAVTATFVMGEPAYARVS